MTLLFDVGDPNFSNALKDYISPLDFFVFIIYLVVFGILLSSAKKKNIEKNPAYKYFLTGFYVKLLFAFIFSFIYLFYYKGGDAINYFWSTRAVTNLLLSKPQAALSIIVLNHRTVENWMCFYDTPYLPVWHYFFQQEDSFGVIRFSSPFMILGFNLWLPCLVLLNLYLYRGIWKFFLLVCKFYPGNIKWNAISILFIPSVLFWGSGIMKDSYTLTASLWLVTNLYYCFIERKRFMNNFLMLIVNVFILVTLKPYIFVALIPPSLIWVSFLYIKKIENKALRMVSSPVLTAIGIVMGILVLRLFQSSLGVYGTSEGAIKQAQVVQQDLTRSEQYGENYYDIGEFDASFSGVLSKAPMAIVTGLFRPFIWEANNIVMLISGLENFILLIFSLYIIIRIGLKAVYRVIVKEPLIIFSLVFSIIFAFSVGLASANFGALVRYRILATPFLLVALINTFYLIRKGKKESQGISNTNE